MRPGQISSNPEPADETRSPDVKCPTCGSAWHVDAAACGDCGWRLPLEGGQASATLCPLCHQVNCVDSLTGRCTRCHPIKINDIQPALQHYARKAQNQRYKELAVAILIGPVAVAICAHYSKGGLSTPLLLSLIAMPILMGAGVYSFIRKGTTSLRYYRLGFVMRYAKPVDAELKYESGNRGFRAFNLCRLGPDSLWPSGLDKKIRVDIPESEDEQVVGSKNKLEKFFKGVDPFERPTLWAKVYFDPDQSGSSVIRIANSTYVSVFETNRFI